MATIKVTKGWIEQYFGIRIDRPEQYSSYWQTDGGTATQDFDRLPEDEYEIVHRSSSKTYWGKYTHPTVPPLPFGAEQHTQMRTATYGEADKYKKQIVAGWKAGAQLGEDSTTKSQDYFWEKESREAGFIVGKMAEILVDDKDFVHAPAMYKAGDTGTIVKIGASSAGWTVEVKLDYPRGKGREGKIHHRIFLPNQVRPTKERLLVRDERKQILIKEEEISTLEGIVRAYYSDIQTPIAERHYSVPYPTQTANAKYEAIGKLWSDIHFYLAEKRVSNIDKSDRVQE